jgi:hypothetical protein
LGASVHSRDEMVAALTRAALDGLHDVARALAAELQRLDDRDVKPAKVIPLRRGG